MVPRVWVQVYRTVLLLTLAFRDPIRAMAGMKIQNCHEKLSGDSLCRNHAIFTLTIMFITDVVLF